MEDFRDALTQTQTCQTTDENAMSSIPRIDPFDGLSLRGGDGSRSLGPADDDEDEEELEGDVDDQDDQDQDMEEQEDDDNDYRSQTIGRRESNDATSNSDFAPGAIVRVLCENFITYERAEFFPGSKLNMVIGPNGTGKSSLVCAICLGLGYPPNVLGRSSKLCEFVKHGCSFATVEVELKKRPREKENHIVKLRIEHDSNSHKFHLNGRKVGSAKIQELVKSFRIQIDNLCQFLPQDKVAEFAALNPVDLLGRTLEAAAPPEMMQWKDQLKELYKHQKEAKEKTGVSAEKLKINEDRLQGLQADVEKLRERKEVQGRIADLEKAHKLALYQKAREEHKKAKEQKKLAERELKNLEKSFAPSLDAVKKKQEYANQVEAAVRGRKQALAQAERAADAALVDIESTDSNHKQLVTEREAENGGMQTLRKSLQQTRKNITDLEAKLKTTPKEFDGAEWNRKIREQAHLQREKSEAIGEIEQELARLKGQGSEVFVQGKKLEKQLASLDTQEGKRLNDLQKSNTDAFKGWKWLEENKDKFDQEVFGPPLLNCSLKDQRYCDLIQAAIPKSEFFTFTVQTQEDQSRLTHQFYKEMGLMVTIRKVAQSLDQHERPISNEELRELGLDGFAVDFLDGPAPVLSMLCVSSNLHMSPVGLKDIDEEQYNRLTRHPRLRTFVAGKQTYKVTRRAEYGPDATATNIVDVQRGLWWRDEPVDSGEKAALRRQLDECNEQVGTIRDQMNELKEKRKAASDAIDELKEKERELTRMKNDLQREYNTFQAVPNKIEFARKEAAKKAEDIAAAKERIQGIDDKIDGILLKKAQSILAHQALVPRIREAYHAMIEAQTVLLEAQSEVRALEADVQDITLRLNAEKENIKTLERTVLELREVAVKTQEASSRIVFDEDEEGDQDGPHRQRCIALATTMSTDEIMAEVDANLAKLDVIRANNPDALRESEALADEIEKLRRYEARLQAALTELDEKITKIRGEWEPRLDDLISKINDAFSYNFEQISCAGEVGVHKDDEDFDKWAIEIKVKFRPNETLQRLDQHRQSGGERAVSTIFYLMSLQSMAQAPFRVVDEINQGMDPRNERMVHERMVEIACREHTSQYFLITPKLLSGLRYDEGMRVLCIASGTQMPVKSAEQLKLTNFVAMRKRYLAHLKARA